MLSNGLGRTLVGIHGCPFFFSCMTFIICCLAGWEETKEETVKREEGDRERDGFKTDTKYLDSSFLGFDVHRAVHRNIFL